MQIVDMSSFVSQKRCLLFPGKSSHDMQIEKKKSQTDCIDLIQGQWQTAKCLSLNVTRGADTSDSGISRRLNHQNLANLKKVLFILIALKSSQ